MGQVVPWCQLSSFAPSMLRLQNIKESDGKSYYSVHAAILRADDYGLPQSRRRLFIVALRRRRMKRPWKWPLPQKKKAKLGSILDMGVRGQKHRVLTHVYYLCDFRKDRLDGIIGRCYSWASRRFVRRAVIQRRRFGLGLSTASGVCF